MDRLDLHHLRGVVTLAEEMNFGRAASRLHMSQPPLSRLIGEVERIVGARLFERTTRRVSLTPIGEVFVAEARAVLARMEAATESVRAAVRRQAGKLRIAYTPLALLTVLPPAIARLRERDHDVSVDLVELPSSAQREALADGHVEMAFAGEPLELNGFESLLLYREPLRVVFHAAHPLAEAARVELGALAEETLILHAREEHPRYYDRLVGACEEAGFTPRVYHREARQNCMALVAAGEGILLSSRRQLPALPPGLRSAPLEAAPAALSAEVWGVLPVTPPLPRVAELREIIRAESRSALLEETNSEATPWAGPRE